MGSQSVSDLQRNEDKIILTRSKSLSNFAELIKFIPFVSSV